MNSIVLCDDGHPEKVLPLCEKYDLGIEIQGFYDPNTTKNKNELISLYKSILPINIEKHIHAPFWDLCLGSANEKIVEVTKYYFDYAYSVANELDCKSITVHHGFVPNTSHPANWIKRSVKFWESFFNEHQDGIKIHMENMLEQNPDTLIGIIDAYKNDSLSINLDIGHAHCNSSLPVTAWIKQLGGRIKYVHLHQNDGHGDQHLGLRQGNMPITDILALLEECAPKAVWALECGIDYMEDSIDYLKECRFLK